MTDLQPTELCLVVDSDHCQTWMGPDLDEQVEPGRFAPELLGNFVCHWTEGEQQEFRTLDPFICYLPDAQQDRRLHCYDSIYRYTAKRKEVAVLEYEFGFKQTDQSLAADLEAAFTAELLTQAFQRHRTRMEVIEGRVASFAELLAAHADIVGRQFAIDHVTSFLSSRDRGMLLIEAEPGKGKTALIAHLIEEVFGLHSPPPVHFLYRRTAGLTDPDVCVKSIYHGLLDAHNLTEAVESRQQDSPEETYNKLTRLLEEQIAPRLSPGRPQLISMTRWMNRNRRRGVERHLTVFLIIYCLGYSLSPPRGMSAIEPGSPAARMWNGSTWTRLISPRKTSRTEWNTLIANWRERRCPGRP